MAGSVNFVSLLFLVALPDFLTKYLLWILTAPISKHRQHLIEKYQQSPKWSSYSETAIKYQLNENNISNSFFDMIHIAATAGTTMLLYSVIAVLSTNEELRNKVIAEVDAVWNDKEKLSVNALSNSKVINQVILETARLYPPVRFVTQKSPEAGEIDFGEVKCPFQKGTLLVSSIFSANRYPKRYQNPDSFDIERDFSDILSWNGYGHERVCIGKGMSIGLINIFCLYLFKKYKWESFTEVNLDSAKFTQVIPNDLVLKGFARF